MTTTNDTNATNASTDLIGAERLTTPAQAKGAAKPRTTRPAKPAAKDAAKPAAKDGKKAPAKAKATASGKQALYFIATGRPASGAALQAHTQAFMQIYGMLKGQGAPLKAAQRVMGATAVNYHKTNARFEVRDGKVFLTGAGVNHFAARQGAIDGALVAVYVAILTTGKADGNVVKAQANIAAIG